MSSLRLALKLSMAENPKASSQKDKFDDYDQYNDVLSVRKRKRSTSEGNKSNTNNSSENNSIAETDNQTSDKSSKQKDTRIKKEIEKNKSKSSSYSDAINKKKKSSHIDRDESDDEGSEDGDTDNYEVDDIPTTILTNQKLKTAFESKQFAEKVNEKKASAAVKRKYIVEESDEDEEEEEEETTKSAGGTEKKEDKGIRNKSNSKQMLSKDTPIERKGEADDISNLNHSTSVNDASTNSHESTLYKSKTAAPVSIMNMSSTSATLKVVNDDQKDSYAKDNPDQIQETSTSQGRSSTSSSSSSLSSSTGSRSSNSTAGIIDAKTKSESSTAAAPAKLMIIPQLELPNTSSSDDDDFIVHDDESMAISSSMQTQPHLLPLIAEEANNMNDNVAKDDLRNETTSDAIPVVAVADAYTVSPTIVVSSTTCEEEMNAIESNLKVTEEEAEAVQSSFEDVNGATAVETEAAEEREDDDDEIEATTTVAAVTDTVLKKRKKKRRSNADCIDNELLNLTVAIETDSTGAGDITASAGESGESTLINRYQSHRAAAVVAKSRLATPRQSRGSGTSGDKSARESMGSGGMPSESTVSTTIDSSNVNNNGVSKSARSSEPQSARSSNGPTNTNKLSAHQQRKNSSSAKHNSHSRSANSTSSNTTTTDECPWQWVACDGCSKWRKLPLHVNFEELPEQWYCHMNIWDDKQNSCDYPEDTTDGNNSKVTNSKSIVRGAEDDGYKAIAAGEDSDVNDDSSDDNDDGDGDDGDDRRQSSQQKQSRKPTLKRPSTGGGRWGHKNHLQQQQQQQEGDDGENRTNMDDSTPATGANNNDNSNSNSNTSRTMNKRKGGGGGGRWGHRHAQQQSQSMSQLQSNTASNAAATGGNHTISSSTTATAPPATLWVQCNKCKKWRKVPSSINIDELPEVWYCIQNTWAPAFARCNVKEESATSDSSSLATSGVTSNSNNAENRSRRYSNNFNNNNNAIDESLGYGAGNTSSSSTFGVDGMNITSGNAASGTSVVSSKKVTQWVQCERKNCKKWRKLPAHVDMSALPEKWYCEMNKWDADRDNCGGPEESDSDNEYNNNTNHIKSSHNANTTGSSKNDGGGSGSSSSSNSQRQLILANSKGPGTLSYRRIIFGTDGKIRPVFSEKNKNGYGLFSFTDTSTSASSHHHHHRHHLGSSSSSSNNNNENNEDVYIEPVRRIHYWWSGCYQQSPSLQTNIINNNSSINNNNTNSNNNTDKNESNSSANQSFHNSPQSSTGFIRTEETATSQSTKPSEPTYLLDVFRHKKASFPSQQQPPSQERDKQPSQSQPQQQPSNFLNHKFYKTSTTISTSFAVAEITIHERMMLECVMVRSVLSSFPSFFGPTNGNGGGVSLSALLATISTCHFPNEKIEACRMNITVQMIVNILHRLQDAGEVDVTMNHSGEISVSALERLAYVKESHPVPHMPSWIRKSGLPLKLRKLKS